MRSTAQAQAAPTRDGLSGLVSANQAAPAAPAPVQPKRAAHDLWAVLIARIYEVFPLVCPLCGGPMRIIAFITHSTDIRRILDHIGVESEAPKISPARGPPLWEGVDAKLGDEVQAEPDWDLDVQSAPDYEVDQHINW